MAPRLVVVGGGAGGLELATRLGDKHGKRSRARVTLVDRSRTHLWKPLLHEIAAGSMNIHSHQLDYLAQARWHNFTFVLGALAGLDRAAKEVVVAPVKDDEGQVILPERRVRVVALHRVQQRPRRDVDPRGQLGQGVGPW